MTIALRIDRCVLDGALANGRDAASLQEAIASRLRHRLLSDGLPPGCRASLSLESSRGATLPLPRDRRTTVLGTAIADAIYEGLPR